MVSSISIYSADPNDLTVPKNSSPSVTIVRNPSRLQSQLYRATSGGYELIASLEPGQSLYLSDYGVNAGTTINFKVGGSDYFIQAPGRASILVTESGLLVSNNARDQFQTKDGLWDNHAGFGLVDYAKALGIEEARELATDGKNNIAAFNTVGAQSALAAGITGKGVIISIVGDGIANSAEIDPKIIGSYDISTKQSSSLNAAGAYNAPWHDLAVASILVGASAADGSVKVLGVAPDARLLNVSYGASSNFWEGVKWSVDNGAKVILIEVSTNGNILGTSLDTVWRDTIKYAFDRNAVVIFTSGNNSIFGSAGWSVLASEGMSVSVGNYDIAQGEIFASSNLAGNTPSSWVVAPSTGYTLTSGGYNYSRDGGTSFAGPYVAGLAALLFEKYPNATARFVIDRITSTANMLDPRSSSIMMDRRQHKPIFFLRTQVMKRSLPRVRL
jgi:hypothetical protein